MKDSQGHVGDSEGAWRELWSDVGRKGNSEGLQKGLEETGRGVRGHFGLIILRDVEQLEEGVECTERGNQSKSLTLRQRGQPSKPEFKSVRQWRA